MLVLSRHVDDTIVFPDLDISIQVLHLKGKSVRIGVDAPIEVKIMRGELSDESDNRVSQEFALTGESEHEIRNKLNALNIAFALAKKLVDRGEFNLAATRLYEAVAELNTVSPAPEESPTDGLLTALLVEDVDNEREMLAGFLRLHGISVATVPSGEKAIEFLESNTKPDFMMVDIGLPGKSGADLIREIRANPAFDRVKLFAISGQTPKQASINPTKNRIAKWFQKPLKPTHLISEIERTVAEPGLPSTN